MRASFSRSMHKRTSTYFSPLFDEMEEVSPEAGHRSRAHAAPREREAYGHNHRPAVAPSNSPMPIYSDTQYTLSLIYSPYIVLKYTLIYPPYIVHHDVFALCPGLGHRRCYRPDPGERLDGLPAELSTYRKIFGRLKAKV